MSVAESILDAAARKALAELPDHELAHVARAAGDERLAAIVRSADGGLLRGLFAGPAGPSMAPAPPAPAVSPTAGIHGQNDQPAADEEPDMADRIAAEMNTAPAPEERRGTRPIGRGAAAVGPVLQALRSLGGKATLKQIEETTGIGQTVVARASRILERRGAIRRSRPMLGTTRGAPVWCELAQ